MPRLASVLLVSLAVTGPVAANPPGTEVRTAAIAQETLRVWQGGPRIINLWWLPREYWEAAARELKRDAQEIEAVRRALEDYIVLVVIDARLTEEQGLQFRDHAEIGPRLKIEHDGEPIGALQRWNPTLTELVPNLSHPLRVAAGPLSGGVRLLFFPNRDAAGEPLVDAAGRGVLRARYTPGGDTPPLDLVWHVPLTAVAGPRQDPQTGEPLEASWRYNPWTGAKLPE